MRRINREFRQIDKLTDVLSFPMLQLDDGKIQNKITDSDLINPDSDFPDLFLGDILISIDKAEEQAMHLGHSLEREIGFLALHGMLHLLGYDHTEPDREEIMITKQNEILNMLAIFR